MSSILTVTDMWYFPVMIQNEIRCILVVDYMDGKWQAVSLGYAEPRQVPESGQTELACGERIQSGVDRSFPGEKVSGAGPGGARE